jgi:hypothetical protein
MNREQRRRSMQREGIKPGVGLVERPLETKVGINRTSHKVVIEYSLNLNHVQMPPEEAIKMARHLALAARHLNPDLAWPKEAE